MRPVALKALLGFLVGLALWSLLSPLYDPLVARGAQLVLRAFEKPPVTRLRYDDGKVIVDRSDFDPRSPRPTVNVIDLTFNVILLTALFATSRRPFSDRNMLGFAMAAPILAITHVLAVIASVMSLYVARLGLWSRVNYSDLERNVWGVAAHSYRVVLMYAIAFGLWWAFRDRGEEVPERRPKKRR